ncbi:MAG: L-threonylcarbamoyladenylate synthase [Acidobacteriota bacterium]
MKIVPLPAEEVAKSDAFAASRWRPLPPAGGVLAIPTESSYGLAAAPDDRTAVDRVFALKGRRADQPLPVVVASMAQLAGLGVKASKAVRTVLGSHWPAPLTAVLPIAEPLAASAGRRTLAVRRPAHAGLRRLLEETGPLTATSANRSGEAPFLDALSVADWMAEFGRRDGVSQGGDAVIDGGRLHGGPPSTLIDLSGSAPRVLRLGAFQGPALDELMETAAPALTYRD